MTPPPDPSSTWPRRVARLAGLWVPALALAALGFRRRWGIWPSIGEVALGGTLLAPFALPKAFCDAAGWTAESSLDGLFVAMAVFWPVVFGLAVAHVRTGSRTAAGLLAVVLAVGSWRWLVVAVGMLGL